MLRAIFSVILVAGLVGCGESPKKAADKMNNRVDQGNELSNQGSEEYLKARLMMRTLSTRCGELSKCDIQDLESTKEVYLSSRQKLLAARTNFTNALSLADKNKDQVRVSGRANVERAISQIDTVVAQIDKDTLELDEAQNKARNSNQNGQRSVKNRGRSGQGLQI